MLVLGTDIERRTGHARVAEAHRLVEVVNSRQEVAKVSPGGAHDRRVAQPRRVTDERPSELRQEVVRRPFTVARRPLFVVPESIPVVRESLSVAWGPILVARGFPSSFVDLFPLSGHLLPALVAFPRRPGRFYVASGRPWFVRRPFAVAGQYGGTGVGDRRQHVVGVDTVYLEDERRRCYIT